MNRLTRLNLAILNKILSPVGLFQYEIEGDQSLFRWLCWLANQWTFLWLCSAVEALSQRSSARHHGQPQGTQWSKFGRCLDGCPRKGSRKIWEVKLPNAAEMCSDHFKGERDGNGTTTYLHDFATHMTWNWSTITFDRLRLQIHSKWISIHTSK